MNQKELATLIRQNLISNRDKLRDMWEKSTPVRHCYLDQLLPESIALKFHAALPDPGNLMVRDSIKERKRVGIRLEDYAPEMSAILYAFQEPEVIEAVAQITDLKELSADKSLYGSGISQMIEGDFLLPHLDNSHDGDGKLYRVLNLLYYITPDWPENAGGNLELWDKAMKKRVEIHSRFNRLVLMETHTESVHGVTRVTKPGGVRSCISNYYFSPIPANQKEHIHKTTFFARPEDSPMKKLQLGVENLIKRFFSGVFKNDQRKTKHRR